MSATQTSPATPPAGPTKPTRYRSRYADGGNPDLAPEPNSGGPAPGASGSGVSGPGASGPGAAAGDPELSHREILEILAGLLAALFTAVLSSTIVSNALPTIIADLEGSQTQYTWVVTASLLAMTVSTPVWGKLSDLLSKKLLVQLAIVAFVIGSMLAGASQNVPFLIGARVLQGIAMGGLMALAQAIIGAAIPPRNRGRYSGYMGAVMALATVSGPLVGGVIVDTSWLGWRWCFYVCVPLAVVSLIVLQKFLHLPLVKRRVRMDYLGAVLIAGAASLPLIWVSFAGQHFPWWSWQTGAYLGGTALLGVLAVVVETHAREPLVPVRVVRERTTALAILASLSVGIAMFGSAVFLGQYFQVARGYSATEAGLLTIPMMFGSFLGSVGSGQLITRYGKWKRYLVLGGLFLTAGLGVLGTIDHTSPYWYVGVGMLAMGIGMGMTMQNLVLAVQNTVDVSEVGAASATVTFFRSLGGAVGVSVLGAILATRVTDLIAEHLRALGPGAEAAAKGGSGSVLDVNALPAPVAEIVRHAYGDATGRIFIIAAGAAIISLLAVLFIQEVPLRQTVAKTPTPNATAPTSTSAGGTSATGDVVDDPAERAAVVALDVIISAERTARERERQANEHVQAAADTIRQMRTDVADLFTRVDQQIADLEETLPGTAIPHPAAALLDSQRPTSDLSEELRRYELSVLSASQRTADHLRESAQSEATHLRESARTEAEELRRSTRTETTELRLAAQSEATQLLTEARAEEQEIRTRITELQSIEQHLLTTVRDNLSTTPPPRPTPTHTTLPPHTTPTHPATTHPTHGAAHSTTPPHGPTPAQGPTPTHGPTPAHGTAPTQASTHASSTTHPPAGNGYPDDSPHRQPFG
ncbi:MDR family MFS transporter [Kribbella solani]|uniref:EmrB/QacA subfamily drug resistance transporter n=1 Tax=Kribbella solani TaxID=236067 RepID=A0A841DTB7_9ACTN|nr:MFS transporter [Kribbella solani]MBB5981259.1 EmrB/QacA subfamily drug resistance transporter [Kribbella solani]